MCGLAARPAPVIRIDAVWRPVTYPKIFVRPTPVADAMRFIDTLLDAPGVHVPALGGEWPVLRNLCLEKDLSANDQGDHLVTFDRDSRLLLQRRQFTRLDPQK